MAVFFWRGLQIELLDNERKPVILDGFIPKPAIEYAHMDTHMCTDMCTDIFVGMYGHLDGHVWVHVCRHLYRHDIL